MQRSKKQVRICLIVLIVGAISYHFRLDISSPSMKYNLMPGGLYLYEDITKSQVVLLEETPVLKHNRQVQIEEIFWREINYDSLLRYRIYEVVFFLQTKHLTVDFKEGSHYADSNYSVWTDGIMDWRNHLEDQVGTISLRTRADGTGAYYVDLLEPKGGFRFLVKPSLVDRKATRYTSIRELYERKRKEFGI